jgi:signal transduction histidine kinase
VPVEMLPATVPLAMSAAAVLAGGRIRTRRRTRALNRALHEVRRPLQALALASPDPTSIEPVLEALADLDAEINGPGPRAEREPVEVRNLAEAVVARWARAARGGGARPCLRWRAGRARVLGDRTQLTRALDNLVANAIEHGRGPIEVRGSVRGDRLRILVRDGGPADRTSSAGRDPRRGHGLGIVREVASAHGGRFVLRCSDAVTIAVLELPVSAGPGHERAAA